MVSWLFHFFGSLISRSCMFMSRTTLIPILLPPYMRVSAAHRRLGRARALRPQSAADERVRERTHTDTHSPNCSIAPPPAARARRVVSFSTTHAFHFSFPASTNVSKTIHEIDSCIFCFSNAWNILYFSGRLFQRNGANRQSLAHLRGLE